MAWLFNSHPTTHTRLLSTQWKDIEHISNVYILYQHYYRVHSYSIHLSPHTFTPSRPPTYIHTQPPMHFYHTHTSY